MKFKTKKMAIIATSLTLGGSIVGGVGFYIGYKPQQTNIGQFNLPSDLDYKLWAKNRVLSANQQRLNPNTVFHTIPLEKKVQEANGVSKYVPRKSISGFSMFRYGKSVFAIDDKQSQQITQEADLFQRPYQLSALELMRQLLAISGYDYPNKKVVTNQDALDFIGKYLNNNLPFYGASLGLSPIEILSSAADETNFYELYFGNDQYAFSQEYAARPFVDFYNLMGSTFRLFLRQYYSPNSLDKDISENTQWANSFVYVLQTDTNNPFGSNYISSQNGYQVWRNVVNDLFATQQTINPKATNHDFATQIARISALGDQPDYYTQLDKLFANSYYYKTLTQADPEQLKAQPNADVNTLKPKFAKLGSTVGDVKRNFQKWIQKIAISAIQNLKVALLQAQYAQITKYALANNDSENNYQVYGYRDNNQALQGFKKNVYDKFKALFEKNATVSHSVFGALQTDNPLVNNYGSADFIQHEYETFNLSNNTFTKDADYNYKAAFGAQNNQTYAYTSSPITFGLNSINIPLMPATFNFQTGLYDQAGVDTEHYLIAGAPSAPYAGNSLITNNRQPLIDKNGRSIRVNAWFPFTFGLKDKDFAVNSDKITGDIDQAASWTANGDKTETFQGYLIANESSGGMNISTGQFYPILNAFAHQEVDYYNDPTHSTEYNNPDHDPATVDTLRKFRLDNFMKITYSSFTNQSRTKVYYLLDSDNQRVGEKTEDDKIQDASHTEAATPYAINSLGTAYTYYSIAAELYKNVSDFASTLPKYNKAKTNPGIIHWKSMDDFNEAFTFYMVNLGGTRSYLFRNKFLSANGTKLITNRVNTPLGANSFTIDGNQFNWKPSAIYSPNYNSLAKYQGFVTTYATLLNFGFGNDHFYDLSNQTANQTISQQTIVDVSDYFFYLLSVFAQYHKVEVFNADGSISEISKKFIQLFESEVLGMNYFVSQVSFNEKSDELGTIYGYFNSTNEVKGLTNTLTKKPLALYSFHPQLFWAQKIGQLGGTNNQPNLYHNNNFENKLTWSVPGFSFGLFQNTDFIAQNNTHNTINYLKFDTNLSSLNNINTYGELANGYSREFAPMEFGYDQARNQIFVTIKKNYLLPN